MDDPIQALIRENPTPAVFVAPQVSGYDPAQTYATPEAGAAQPAVACLFGYATATGPVVAYKATASFTLADLAAPPPGVSELTVAGLTFTIQAVRKRFWHGVQNGWTLELV